MTISQLLEDMAQAAEPTTPTPADKLALLAAAQAELIQAYAQAVDALQHVVAAQSRLSAVTEVNQ